MKFDRIVEGNVLNNMLKVPADRRTGSGEAFKGDFFQFFLNISKTMQVRRKILVTKLNYVKFPIKMLFALFM